MGIRGLTTFIENRSHLYLEDHELHDTYLVIDGNSVACQLYRWHCPNARDCFGGDYDVYARCVASFFHTLSLCRIVPIVVYDGGYEDRKLNTVLVRMRTKVEAAASLSGSTEGGSAKVFPLFLREAFEEVVCALDVRAVRCDFEGDSEAARIAAALSCPVVSYDSDFFVFDVPYVPFNTVEMKASTHPEYRYLQCRVFRIERFLKAYGGVDRSHLPLLAALLGNDYVKRATFGTFYQNMKKQGDQQRRIKALMKWLGNETRESALEKILSRYRKSSRKELKKKIWDAVRGYSLIESRYLEYLGLEEKESSGMETEPTEEEESSQSEEMPENSSESESDSPFDEFKHSNPPTFDPVFFDKFRRCRYPAYFMDMLVRNQYHCVQQVEDMSSPSSHIVSYRIISAIHKILLSSKRKLLCFNRIEGSRVGKELVETFESDLPRFDRISTLSHDERRDVLLQVLQVSDGSLGMFPPSWHLFLLALSYCVSHEILPLSMIYSLVLCKFTIGHLDKKTSALFKRRKPRNYDPCDTSEALYSLDNVDCSSSIDSLRRFFKMDDKVTERHSEFDRTVVHSLSQFQSVLMHSSHLNRLLDNPFENFVVSETLNCTFAYNFAVTLRRRNSYDEYVRLVLQDDEVVSRFEKVMGRIKEMIGERGLPEEGVPKKRKKRRRRKKKEEESVGDDEEVEDKEDEVDGGGLFDPNNRFAILGIN